MSTFVVLGQFAGQPAATATVHTQPSATLTARQGTASLPGFVAYVVDSNFYTSTNEDTLSAVTADGSNARVLLAKAPADIGLLALSPGGQELAYFTADAAGAGVKVMTLSTKKAATLFKLRGQKAFVDGIAWSADGSHVMVGTNEQPGTSHVRKEAALWSMPAAGGVSARLTPFEDAGTPAVGPTGDIFYVVSASFSTTSLHKSALWTASPTGADARVVYSSRHFMQSPAPDPDGQSLAVEVVDNTTSSHLVAVTLTQGSATNLTPLVKGRDDVQPSWSPDGAHLAFLSSRAGRTAGSATEPLLDAYDMTATGTGVTEMIGFRHGTESVGAIAWGP